jgi:hypothetical protein
MSGTEQMTEFDARVVAEAETDLGRLLSIEPSPEFAAKVRARIAAEPPTRSWRWGRLGLALAAASALIVVFALRGVLSVQDDRRPFSSARHDDVALSAPDLSPAKTVVTSPPAQVAVNRPVHPAEVPQRGPEVIIDPAVTDAIRRLAIAARSTTLDASKGESIAADAQSAALPVAEPLNVPELVLKPADQTGGQ